MPEARLPHKDSWLQQLTFPNAHLSQHGDHHSNHAVIKAHHLAYQPGPACQCPWSHGLAWQSISNPQRSCQYCC